MGKYPTHHVAAHGEHARYCGSASLNDRFKQPKEHSQCAPARGKTPVEIGDGHREHVVDTPKKNKHSSVPGHTNMMPFTEAHDGCNHKTPHSFRAHKGNVSKEMGKGNPLRYSGNSSAHRIGAKCPTFKKDNYHTQGISGGREMANIKPIGKSTSQASTKHAKQPSRGK